MIRTKSINQSDAFSPNLEAEVETVKSRCVHVNDKGSMDLRHKTYSKPHTSYCELRLTRHKVGTPCPPSWLHYPPTSFPCDVLTPSASLGLLTSYALKPNTLLFSYLITQKFIHFGSWCSCPLVPIHEWFYEVLYNRSSPFRH